MNELISVIVPVYGAEKYLEKCVKSITAQSYTNLEIILVDDVSPDNSGKICDELAKEDSRIKVIHRETNGGISTARNTGIEVAKGRYIGFSDCDDYMHKDMFKTLCEMMEYTKSDIVVSSYVEIPDEEDDYVGEPIGDIKEIPTTTLTGVGCMDYLLTEKNVTTILPWNKLYKRELFDGVRFPDGKNGEDDFCIPHLLCAAKKVTFFDSELYFWRARPTSYSRSFKLSRTDYIYVLEEREEFLADKISDELKHRFLVHYMEILWDFYYLVKENYPDKKDIYTEIRQKFINKFNANKDKLHIPGKKMLKWKAFMNHLWVSNVWHSIDEVKRKTIRKIKHIDNYNH